MARSVLSGSFTDIRFPHHHILFKPNCRAFPRIIDYSVNKLDSKSNSSQIGCKILVLNSAFEKIRQGLHSIGEMTKSSALLSIGCKGQKQKAQVVNDQSHQLICDTGMKKDLTETIDGAEDKKGYNGTKLDEDSLNESGKIHKRKSRKNVTEEKDVVKTSRVRIETIKRNETSGNKNPNNRDDEKEVTLDEVCTEAVTNSNSEKHSKKRKTTVKSSDQVEVKSVIDMEVKESVDIVVTKDEPWTLLVHKKLQSQWVAYNPTSMRKPVPSFNCLKILSWNVNGLRALLKVKGTNPIAKLAEREEFDVLCLQETKLQDKDVQPIKETLLTAYENSFWSCSTTKLGYSGTAIISRIKPVSVTYGIGSQEHDSEGRIITLEFDKFYLVTGYIPNSGQKLERLAYRTENWDSSLADFLKDLETRKPVVLSGDLNCAHQEIDIYNPDGNRRSAGFTDEERKSFQQNFLGQGLIDTFRRQHEHVVAYTYWGYRTAARPKNQGWRLDYFLVSEGLLNSVYDSYILPDVGGSDHCPIGLILKT